MSVQTLRPQLAVEGLEEAVISWFATPKEVQGDVVGSCPEVESTGDEFAAIVHTDRLGIAGLSTSSSR